MNNQVKMSNFLNKKKIIIKDGEVSVKTFNGEVNGEIEINTFNSKIVKEIQEKVVNILSDEELKDDNILLYKIFPIITNIENDISLEDFSELMSTPKRPFSIILDMVTDEINNIFNAMNDYKKMDEKLINMKENNKEIFETIQIEAKTKEELLNELYIELQNNIMDKDKREEILNKINKIRDDK